MSNSMFKKTTRKDYLGVDAIPLKRFYRGRDIFSLALSRKFWSGDQFFHEKLVLP